MKKYYRIVWFIKLNTTLAAFLMFKISSYSIEKGQKGKSQQVIKVVLLGWTYIEST